jgi:hypothetical protein
VAVASRAFPRARSEVHRRGSSGSTCSQRSAPYRSYI